MKRRCGLRRYDVMSVPGRHDDNDPDAAVLVIAPAIHPFERAGLGCAPFRCIGYHVSKYQACPGAPVQAGSSCDYCGNGIMSVFTIKSSDGRTFKVGCDCVTQTARACAKTDAERAARALVASVNKVKTAAVNARKDERIGWARQTAERNRESWSNRIWDGVVRHSRGPRSLADQLDWMLSNGGRTLKMRAVSLIEELVS